MNWNVIKFLLNDAKNKQLTTVLILHIWSFFMHFCFFFLCVFMIKILICRMFVNAHCCNLTVAGQIYSLLHSTEIKKKRSVTFQQWVTLDKTLMNRCGAATGESFTIFSRWSREVPLHPPLLGRESQRGSDSDSNHSQQQEKGFTQQGVKPNWLCFIALLARGKWRSEECVCRCYGVLSGEALFHYGSRGWLGQNYSMWEHRRNCVQSFYG